MKLGKVLNRYEIWYTPADGSPERLGRFVIPAQRDEKLRRARIQLSARQSAPGVIEVHDVHAGTAVYRELYPRETYR